MKRKGSGKLGSLNNIILIVLLLLITSVFVFNGMLFYSIINDRSEIIGREKLEMVSSRLQVTLMDSEILLRRIASDSEQLLAEGKTREEFEAFYKKLKGSSDFSKCKNIYIAGEDWYAVPDFVVPESGFDPKERVWFQGARKKGTGITYISSPYLDVVTGSMCFSVSMLLNDKETVVGLDLDLEALQEFIGDISENGGDALIVSSSGQIVGYPDESVVGEKLTDALPQYRSLFRRISTSGVDSMYFNTPISGIDCTVFYRCAANDWYLISTVSNMVLYKEALTRIAANCIISFVLTAVIIILYIMSRKAQGKVEKALSVKEDFLTGMSDELRVPLSKIISYSESISRGEYADAERLRDAAASLDHTLTSILSYSGLSAAAENIRHEKGEKKIASKLSDNRNKRVMLGVIGVLIVTMIVSVLLTTNAIITGGDARMYGEVNSRVDELNMWVTEQKSTVDMFVKIISVDPGRINDYDNMVKWLNDVTKQYDDISVTYMANPEWEPQVVMNNSWKPPEGWRLDERKWYIDTMESRREDGFNISSPYVDDQTGQYCVTFSERVYDMSGNFIGVFAADFYIDKLTHILSESYTDEGYAFLVDSNGTIINHPYKDYELSDNNCVTVAQAGYLDVVGADKVVFINDYDGSRRAALAVSEPSSGFTIIGIKDRFSFYGDIARYNSVFVLLFVVCIASVAYILNLQMKWQKKANEMLRESAEAAEKAGNAKSQFLAHMSHEIRTPINAVLGMNEMILRECSDETILEYSENIRNAGRTLLSLINSILDFSKIEDGKMEIVPVSYDTSSVINDLVNMIRDKADSKGLELRLDIDPKLPMKMYGDDVRLKQVITNLLTNAVKYTETGMVCLRMRADNLTGENVMLHVEVEDTGLGIREEDRQKLFSSFQRLDIEKNRNIEGTGLGMAIVQKLLLMMNSRLELVSVYGEGSRFWFDIRQGVSDPESLGDYTARLAVIGEASGTDIYVYAPDAKILIIDDNNVNLLVAKGLLKRSGVAVDTANSGSDGIKLVSENVYDIILLDHMMPELDGLQTLGIMKERGIVPDSTAIVMMTANAIVGAREEYLNAGFDDYLSKPIDVSSLEKLLEKYIPSNKLSHKRGDGTGVTVVNTAVKAERSTAPATLSKLDKLGLIPELDSGAGLRYCKNNEDHYIQIVKAYIRCNLIGQLDTLFSDEDKTEYYAAIKRLMISSRNIGGSGVAKAAEAVLTASEGDSMLHLRECHRDFMKSYRRLLGSMSNALR